MVFFKTLVAAIAVSAPLSLLARQRGHMDAGWLSWPNIDEDRGSADLGASVKIGTLGGVVWRSLMATGGSASASATATSSGSGGDGGKCPAKISVCVAGEEVYYGAREKGVGMEYANKPGGITLSKASGKWKCEFEEYAGGFDGYPSPEVGDGHEKDLDEAVMKMIPSGKDAQDCFLKTIVANGNPTNMDYPQDAKKADNGARMENIQKLNAACTALLDFNEGEHCSSGSSAPTAPTASGSGSAHASGDTTTTTVTTSTSTPEEGKNSETVVTEDGEEHHDDVMDGDEDMYDGMGPVMGPTADAPGFAGAPWFAPGAAPMEFEEVYGFEEYDEADAYVHVDYDVEASAGGGTAVTVSAGGGRTL